MKRLIIMRNPSIYAANVTEREKELQRLKEPMFTSDRKKAKTFHSIRKAQEYYKAKGIADPFRIFEIRGSGDMVDVTHAEPEPIRRGRRWR